MSGFGSDRLARRLLAQSRALTVPSAPVPDDTPVISRVDFAAAVGYIPDPWQQGVLTSDERKLLMLCCRQSGKSTTAALLASHEAVTVPGSLTLMLAPSLRQSAELFRVCLQIIKGIDLSVPAIAMESTLRLELENGARIIALPGSEATTRGYAAATQVIIDEASRVPDALITAIRPTLATTNGRIVALSTPAGKRGWFYLEATSGTGWYKTTITAADCPRISAEFLEDEARSLGPHQFQQEYFCEFYDDDTQAFASDLIERALVDDVDPLWSIAA